jgi:hypothetical protein
MTSRLLLALTLAFTSFASISGLATDAPSPDTKHDGSIQASVFVPDTLLPPAAKAENSSVLNRNSNPDFPELAQLFVPVASACYTYVGRVCPMVVALPAGSACTCYFADGAFAGIAW